MVVEEILCQLKPCKIVARGNSSHDSSLLKIGKVAIGRTSWNFRNHLFNFRDAYRASRRGQKLNYRSSTQCVTLINSPKENLDKLMEIFD